MYSPQKTRKHHIPHFPPRNFHIRFAQLLASGVGYWKVHFLKVPALSFHCRNPLRIHLSILLLPHSQLLHEFHNMLFPVLFLPHIPIPFWFACPAEQEEVCAPAGQELDLQGLMSRDQRLQLPHPHLWGTRHKTPPRIKCFTAMDKKSSFFNPGCHISWRISFHSILHLPLPVLRVWGKSSSHLISLYHLTFLFHLNLFILQMDIPICKPFQ